MAITLDGTNGVTYPTGITTLGATPSMVRVNAYLGKGSTNTCINRYSTVVTNQGTDITYADSATLGASFTINTNGIYAISMTGSPINSFTGISVNSSQLSTSIDTITAADRLSDAGGGASGVPLPVSSTVYLSAGAVVRPHGTTVADNNPSVSQFTITRVA